MLQLIVRMTTVALLLICGAMAHHVPQPAHHGQCRHRRAPRRHGKGQ
jgi:hypothetical protein